MRGSNGEYLNWNIEDFVWANHSREKAIIISNYVVNEVCKLAALLKKKESN